MAEEVKTGDEVKKVEATVTQSKTMAGSSDPMMNLLVIGIVCFVVGFFVADALNVNYLGASTTTTTIRTLPSSTTTTMAQVTKVNMIVLNDARCPTCVAFQMSLSAQLRTLFPDVEVTIMDYSKPDGKALYDSTGVGVLPAVLFDDTVKSAENYAQVQPYLEAKGKYLSLRIGASFDPTAEICDNSIDDTGDGKVDCADDDCVSQLVCREEKKNDVQVFIMSDCPYGRQAIVALKSVVDNFGSNLTFAVHYIAGESGGKFSSLHGQYEVDEDIIQLCTKKHSPQVWFNYMYCRSLKSVSGADWKVCAKNTSVDIAAVQACFDGDEGKALLREDMKIADSIGIGASPTWIANNRYQFSGIDAETIKTNICSHNPTLSACNATLSSNTSGVAAGSCT